MKKSVFYDNQKTLKQLEILHEDDSCIVVNKPAGLPTQGGKGVGVSLDSILAETCPQRPLLVHRLDRDTSGIVLAAKNKAAAAGFSRLFDSSAGKGVIKRYHAVCRGIPEKPEGSIKLDLLIRGAEKESITRYRQLAETEEFSLLELELLTGRTHQIRRHLFLTGNPVLGDDKYGDFALNRSLRKTMKLKRMLLHASRLIIPQTPGGGSLDISAPLPAYFRQFMHDAGISFQEIPGASLY